MKVNLNNHLNFKQSSNVRFSSHLKEQEPDEISIKEKKTKPSFKEKTQKFFKGFKNFMAVVASSLVTGLAVFAITSKKNVSLKNQNDELKAQNEALNMRINNIVLPENMEVEVAGKIDKLNKTSLSYSPTAPIQADAKDDGVEKSKNKNKLIVMPKEYEKTTLRNDAVTIKYPEFKENQPYSFQFPSSEEITITTDSTPVTPQPRTLTTVSESYADSLVWNNDKIARDLMQNFYDGHGQTLDGVKFNATPTEDGGYKIRIEGKSTYSADKAILLGESSKKNNNKAAGNYGEGLKMVVLKLLKEKGADEVNIASNNWNVNWNFQDSGFGKKVLAYKLDEVEPIDGNYIEFKTNDSDFVKSIVNTFDRFYHYNNSSFKCPDFENDMMGIKLAEGEKNGKFYIAGQAFELDGKYDGLNDMHIYLKKKPPVKVKGELIFDPSRDRTSLNANNLRTLGQWVVSKDNMSKEDAVKLIHSLEKYWDVGTNRAMFKHNTKGTSFISGIFMGARDREDLNIQFPDNKYISDSIFVSSSLADKYEQAGYKICSSVFKYMGMPSVEDLVAETRKHKPIEPSESEKNKMLILKEAIQLLSPVLKEEDLFSDEELDSKIFLYDRNASNEDASYRNVTGEAIIDNKKSLGFWLDKTALAENDFSTMFGTSLHELCHKYGGDESEAFSYKLTDVLEKVLKAINSDPNLATKFKILDEAWKAQK